MHKDLKIFLITSGILEEGIAERNIMKCQTMNRKRIENIGFFINFKTPIKLNMKLNLLSKLDVMTKLRYVEQELNYFLLVVLKINCGSL
jgi:hypothetical protein